MKSKIIIVVLMTVGCLISFTTLAEEDIVIARVGDIEIRQSAIDLKIKEIPPYARAKFESVEGQISLLDRIVRTKVLMKAAVDAGYAEKPDVKLQLQEATERILSSIYFQENMSSGPMPDEKEMKKYYEDHRDEDFRTDATVEARHIVVETEETANKVRKMIENKELTFEKAVEIYSNDKSKESEGRIGPLRKNGFIRGIGRSKPFIEMVFALKADEIGKPYKTRIGWHIVQLLKMTNAGFQPYETVKESIAKELMISRSEIQKEYTDNQDEYKARARCKISHILTKTQEEAEEIYRDLQNGKDFVHLVKTCSIDQQSVKQEGNLGYLYKGGYIRGVGKDVEFETAVFELAENTVSRPLKSRKGWHIVRVDEKEDEAIKSLVEVEDQIRQKLVREKKEQFLEAKFEELQKMYQTQVFKDRLKAKN
ncbi:peptidylprolyl isomerase [bacterium]|nr:peptidylprolyl isomerase [bacterium]